VTSPSVRFGRGALAGFAAAFRFPPGRAFLVSSPTVLRLHGDSIRAALAQREVVEIAISDGEPAKTMENLGSILDRAIEAGIRRDDYIVAAGGGVVTDIAGFAAAILLRGVAWFAVPTTLLGMADASIGGKTAVDHPLGKNLIGAFHFPEGVLVDPELLATLTAHRFREGLVEIYKTLLVGEGSAARRMAGRLESLAETRDVDGFLESAIRIKQDIVARDPRETGERRILNFGHTLGHAIEAAGAYERWSHGDAVAIGMAAALTISAQREGFSSETATALASELVAFSGEKATLPPWTDALEQGLLRDKKSTVSGISGVLLSDWGKPLVREVPLDQWKEALLRLGR